MSVKLWSRVRSQISLQFFICRIWYYSIAGGSILFEVREYITSPKQELKYDLFIMTDVLASGSVFTVCHPVLGAAGNNCDGNPQMIGEEEYKYTRIATIYSFSSDQLY